MSSARARRRRAGGLARALLQVEIAQALDGEAGEGLHTERQFADLAVNLLGIAGAGDGAELARIGILERHLEKVAVHRHGGDADRRRPARLRPARWFLAI